LDAVNKNGKEEEKSHVRELSADEVEVAPEGHLSREDMSDFQSWLDRAMQSGHRVIVLNLQGVITMSSSAIGKILHFKRACDEMGRRLVIRNCGPQMLQLLKMIKFDNMIRIE
jgi:anti-anti-sigma factor